MTNLVESNEVSSTIIRNAPQCVLVNLQAAGLAAGEPPAKGVECDRGVVTDASLQPFSGDGRRANIGTGGFITDAALTDSEEYRIKEANRRLEIVNTFQTRLSLGVTRKQAVKELGESYTTIWRWAKKFKEQGYNGLLPSTDKCGRKSMVEKLGIPQAVIDEIRGINLDTESTTSALRSFAQSDKCPEELARVILDPSRCSKRALPPSIRRIVSVSKAERDAHRGPRQLALNGAYTPRKLDILPGDIFCADDTTPIWAWWVPWEQSEEYPFGVKLLQGQLLPVIDVGSQALLTFALIAREKSSYRASDIWALFGHTFEQIGVPRLGMQLERGLWEANLIAGQEIEYRQDEVTLSRRVGGLRQLPTNITDWHRKNFADHTIFPKTLQTWTSFLPKTKSIEAFFNRSQTLEATLWGSLGRDQMRKPYEKMKKLYGECSRVRAKTDPRQHFLSQTELVTRLMAIWRYINDEPMEGEVFSGVPRLKFDQATQEYPLLHLPEEDAWLYKRDWKKTTIDRSWARVRLTHEISGENYSLFYSNPEIFARYDQQDVVVYYDRENFEQPAQIILARTGEFLCEAAYFERTGSFLQGDKTGHDIRKRWKNAVMTCYGTIAKYAPSRQLPAEIKARRSEAGRQAAPVIETVPVVVTRIPRVETPATVDPAEAQRQRDRFSRLAEIARGTRNFNVEE